MYLPAVYLISHFWLNLLGLVPPYLHTASNQRPEVAKACKNIACNDNMQLCSLVYQFLWHQRFAILYHWKILQLICSISTQGVGNEQFWRTRFPDFSLISLWFPSKMTSYVVKVGGAGGLGWFLCLISRKSALISHDFNLISTDFSTRCKRFLLLPTPRLYHTYVYPSIEV